MLAHVTNRSRGARGFQSVDRGTVMVEPGASARLDLSDHHLHRAWEAAGEVAIAAVAEADPEQAQPDRDDGKPAARNRRGRG